MINLASYTWNHREEPLSLEDLKESGEYKECVRRFPGWESLIDEHVKMMIVDASDFDTGDYVVLDDRIGYKDQDGVSFNIVYGYKTMFCYFHECEKGNISESGKREQIKFNVNCGSFSYAHITEKFIRIMGVTGTLRSLGT